MQTKKKNKSLQMKIKGKNRTLLSSLIFLSFFCSLLFAQLNKTENDTLRIDVGVILDMESLEGKMFQSCISMAISDFYTLHSYYKTRITLHTRDSKGQPLLALSSALDLLENSQIRAIVGAQTSMEANFLAELGVKTKVPLISLSSTTSTSSSNRYPYFVQITQDEISQVAAITDIVETFKWKNIIIIQEDSDDWRNFIPHLVDSLHEKNIDITCKSILTTTDDDGKIVEELHKLKALQQTVFIVHMSPLLTSQIFMNAKELGMMSEGYAWIMTANSMNLNFLLMGSPVIDSMQGVISLRPYIPASKELQDLISRWRKKFLLETNMELMELRASYIWAYDVAWSLARAAEKARTKISTSEHGLVLLRELLQPKFKGLSGELRFNNRKLVSNEFEVVNVIGRGERRVGFWTRDGKITRELHRSSNGRQLSSINNNNLEDIIWPGGSATIPNKISGKKLRIGVLRNSRFPELANIDHDIETNATIITGFCIDVFKTAIESLEYEVDYVFIPFLNASGQNNGTYFDLIYEVYLQKYDAAIGDIMITANRSLYVDFTLPYTDVGVGMISLKDSKSMWIFLKPLNSDLWLSSACFFILTGVVIWLIERPINNEFQGPISQQIGMIFWFSFSTLFFAHREKLVSNLSRFVVIVWLLVVLILTSSYTATLTSMITLEHIHFNSRENYLGDNAGSFSGGPITKMNFRNTHLKPYSSPEEYADALSKGNKKGGISIIIDEIPYIKIFLARYSAHFSRIGSMPISSFNDVGMSSTNGFGFAFRKGSPLVHDMSRAIAKLREMGTLNMMEKAWFRSHESMHTFGDTSNNVNSLTFDSFRGLFLITGVSSALALSILYGYVLYNYWKAINIYNFIVLIQGQFTAVKQSLSTNFFSRT
ncbi:hypothetical protein Pint_03103 [Pistacia integerrima]|uniref:Uncharacterized protein n=1 Tax=Pistacia integerrima TaxID=434235 RepID=A0ACC0ZIU4_9ROSI|nr:hypothetical protein Pint_03103 [Pistacia integerrima]